MGRTTEQVAVHKERYLVPLQLNVSKLSGVGEDTLFIGILEVSPGSALQGLAVKPRHLPVKAGSCFMPCLQPCCLQQLMPEPDTATIWVLRDGTILSAGPVFTDWFAYTAKASRDRVWQQTCAAAAAMLPLTGEPCKHINTFPP
jgi:hypothetical protein